MKTGMTAAGAAMAAMIDGAGATVSGDRAGRMFDRIADGEDGPAATADAKAARPAGRAAKRFERPDANGDAAPTRNRLDAGADDRSRGAEPDGDGALMREELQGAFRRGG